MGAACITVLFARSIFLCERISEYVSYSWERWESFKQRCRESKSKDASLPVNFYFRCICSVIENRSWHWIISKPAERGGCMLKKMANAVRNLFLNGIFGIVAKVYCNVFQWIFEP